MKTYKNFIIAFSLLIVFGMVGQASAITYYVHTAITTPDINSHDNNDVVWNGNEYTLTCTTATDTDCYLNEQWYYPADTVTHTWSGAGTFSPQTGTSVTWYPPDTNGQVTVTVTASDSPLADDADVNDSVTFTLEAGRNVKHAPYNAIGDGVIDDSNAIQQAIDSNDGTAIVLLKDSTFAVDSTIDLTSNTTLLGDNATLKNKNMDSRNMYDDPLLDVSSNCSVKNLILDGNNKRLVGIKIWNEDNVNVENCTVKNFLSSDSYVFGIAIVAKNQDCNNIQITSCTVKDINSVAGSSTRAIYVASSEDDTIYNTDINDCTFDNIRCGNIGYDGDAIHVQTYNHNPYNDPNDPNECYWQPSYVTIENCEFSNYSKRGVKLQCSNATVKNCIFTNVNPDGEWPIAIGTFGFSTTISGNDINDPNFYAGITARYSKNCTIEDNNVVIHKQGECYGITLRDTNDITVTNNQFTAYYGLRLTDEVKGRPPVNNTFNYNTLDVNDIVYRNIPDPNNDNNNTVAPNTFVSWSSTIGYDVNDVVTHDSNDYQCNTAHTNQEPPDPNYWDGI